MERPGLSGSTSTMSMETLHDLDAWRAAVARHPLVMLFKHSPVCPISAAALEEWQEFRAARPDVPALFVDVIADRSVARGLSQECGIAHQSPQAILFKDGKPAWNASHGAITAASLGAACGAG
jgi:bacillithiol system protein YtxJ